ncbi:MAG: M20/M25/M40 family metallo-hydrolase [Acidobacteriota bacterium]
MQHQHTHAKSLPLALAAMLAATIPAALQAAEPVDLAVIQRIKAEAFDNSKVMDHMFYLTDVHGPRLTNSISFHQAADWTVDRLKSFGLAKVTKEKWGPFGKTWNYTRFSAHLLKPTYSPLIGFPMAWTPGTNGPVKGEPILAVIKTEKDLTAFKGKLTGKIVLTDDPRVTALLVNPLGRRYSDKELDAIEEGTVPAGARPPIDREARRRLMNAKAKFLREEGVSLVVTVGYNGDGGTVFAAAGGGYRAEDEVPPPMIALTPEHYNRIARLIKEKQSPELEVDIAATLNNTPADSYNIIGEIPGTSKRDEIVMIGAHFDSWHGGTGATDNAAGSAVMIEVMRILKALDLKMPRTVRIARWSGEELGLLGSKAYVKEHFADPADMRITEQHAKLAGYFNYDNGSGKIRGVYLQGNDMMRPIFNDWFAPFHDLGAGRISNKDTGGTDHLSFNAVGLPGFQFIQDPLEYSTRTHHSNMDTFDHIQEADLKQAAAIIASFVYNTATRPDLLPRKPLPKPTPPTAAVPTQVTGNQ